MRSVHAPAGQLAASAVAAGRCGGRAGRLEGLEGSPARVPTYSIAAQDGTEALRAIRAAILGIRVAPTPGLVPARSADHARGPAVAPDLVLTIFVLDHAPLAHWVFVRVAASGGASDAVTLVDPRRLARAAVPRLSEDLDGVAGRRQSGRRGIGALVVFVVVVVVVVGGCGGAGGRHEARGDRVQRFSAAARAAGRGGRALALDRVALKGPPLSAPANRVAPNLVAPGMLDVALACVAVDVGPLRDIRAPLGQLAAPAVAAGLGGAAAVDGEGAEIAQRLFPADAVAASDGAEAVHPVDTAILSLLVSPTLWFVDACLRDDAGRPAIAPALLLTSHILDDAPIPQGVLVRVAAGVLARQVVLAPLLLARTTAPGLPLPRKVQRRRLGLVDARPGDQAERPAVAPRLVLARRVLHDAPLAPSVLVWAAARVVACEVATLLDPNLLARAAVPCHAAQRCRRSGAVFHALEQPQAAPKTQRLAAGAKEGSAAAERGEEY
mmetsp:Transcript_120150/g.383586  ORF Transcript_120150/g.383586 Transcript_120150/m.383586 type:complete len:496 (-) Transcript_120150:43-1530(-)